MESKKYTYTDSSSIEHSVVITQEDLALVHKDFNDMHDVDLKTKTTTYFKDIVHRFLRNRASVAGLLMISVIVLGSAIVAVSMPEYPISGARPEEVAIAPKLFAAGTGFWDGTVKRDGYIYDEATGNIYAPGTDNASTPINPKTVVNPSQPYDTKTNTASPYARGGYIRLAPNANYDALLTSPRLTFDLSQTYSLNYVIEQGVDPSISEGSYSLLLNYRVTNAEGTVENKSVTIKENATDFSAASQSVDLTSTLTSIPQEDLTNNTLPEAAVSFVSTKGQNKASYLKSFSFGGSDTSVQITGAGFTDANELFLRRAETSSSVWTFSGEGTSGLYGADIKLIDFHFDTYENVYGELPGLLGASNFKVLQDQGILELVGDDGNVIPITTTNDGNDFADVMEPYNGRAITVRVLKDSTDMTFIVDDEHPVTVVVSSGRYRTVQFNVTEVKWRKMGYSSYPLHILGTDNNGYDLLREVAVGTLYSLGIASIVFLFCFLFGLCWGAISGYFGGAVDITMERIVDVIVGIPSMILLTLCLVVWGRSWAVFAFAMCFSGWIGTEAITRTQFYRFKRREYVLASRSLGAGDGRLIFRHILPNGMGTIITSTILMIPSIIFSEAGLAYLGLGFSDIMSLGRILSDNSPYLTLRPLMILWPSLIIALLMISFELFGQGLRDAFNPSTKGTN